MRSPQNLQTRSNTMLVRHRQLRRQLHSAFNHGTGAREMMRDIQGILTGCNMYQRDRSARAHAKEHSCWFLVWQVECAPLFAP